jgi:hypothetical protein
MQNNQQRENQFNSIGGTDGVRGLSLPPAAPQQIK